MNTSPSISCFHLQTFSFSKTRFFFWFLLQFTTLICVCVCVSECRTYVCCLLMLSRSIFIGYCSLQNFIWHLVVACVVLCSVLLFLLFLFNDQEITSFASVFNFHHLFASFSVDCLWGGALAHVHIINSTNFHPTNKNSNKIE